MSKIIVLADIPDQYDVDDLEFIRCDFAIPFNKYGDRYLGINYCDAVALKCLPKLKEKSQIEYIDRNMREEDWMRDGYILGWNACIQKIQENSK